MILSPQRLPNPVLKSTRCTSSAPLRDIELARASNVLDNQTGQPEHPRVEEERCRRELSYLPELPGRP